MDPPPLTAGDILRTATHWDSRRVKYGTRSQEKRGIDLFTPPASDFFGEWYWVGVSRDRSDPDEGSVGGSLGGLLGIGAGIESRSSIYLTGP